MPRFFVRSTQIGDGRVCITGADAHHIADVLRLTAGDTVTVCDGMRHDYTCRLASVRGDEVSADVLDVCESVGEPPVCITLYQALPKGDKLDVIIQKAVECGASRIVPFESTYCVGRCRPEAEARKTERRARIALEAAKQCGRGIVPTVAETLPFSRMLCDAAESAVVFFCYEGKGTQPIGGYLREAFWQPGHAVAVVIGSEGGFSVEEAEQARRAGFFMTNLGTRILRTETASCFALACIACRTELSL